MVVKLPDWVSVIAIVALVALIVDIIIDSIDAIFRIKERSDGADKCKDKYGKDRG